MYIALKDEYDKLNSSPAQWKAATAHRPHRPAWYCYLLQLNWVNKPHMSQFKWSPGQWKLSHIHCAVAGFSVADSRLSTQTPHKETATVFQQIEAMSLHYKNTPKTPQQIYYVYFSICVCVCMHFHMNTYTQRCTHSVLSSNKALNRLKGTLARLPCCSWKE